jgi:hypothetical protein
MGAKRKFKDGLNPSAKHRYSLRSKSKCNQFELENFCERFPHLSEDIFGELDYKSLIKFREVSKFWSENIHEQRIYWIRKIEQCTEKFTEFNKEWKKVVRKRPVQVLKLIEEVTRTLTGLPPSCLGTDVSPLSPLHIAAKFHLGLFKEIAPKFEDKNPANSFGDTPLLYAVKFGHSDICSYIIDNVDENKKNPANKTGFTALHYAAILNNLKIYKLIADNVEDKHPQDNMGITPLHIAVQNGHLDICNFVSDKIVKNEDIHPRSSLKMMIVAINTFKEVIDSKDCLIKLLEKHCV